jgi:NAD(P)H-nitrite reductase large subunit
MSTVNSSRRYLLIGSGAAGIAAAEAIRQQDPSGMVMMATADPQGYYSRPGLAYYLTGELPENLLFPMKSQDFKHLDISLIAQPVKSIHPQEHHCLLADGRQIPYDRLLVATGALAAPLKVPGSTLEGVVKLDSLADANQILKLARRGRTAVVVGGGITALEIVEGLAARGVKTYYLLRGDRYWSNVLDEGESRIVEGQLRAHGVKVLYHMEIAEILNRRGTSKLNGNSHKDSKVAAVRTTDGHVIRCDIVAYAIGIKPRLRLGESAGLHIERGVMVDEHLHTSAEDIYCAGDAAQVYDPLTGTSVLDSLWNPAREQGTIAGFNMAGIESTYLKPVAFNVTRLAGLTTTIIGTVGRGRDDDVTGIARGDSETWRQLPDAIAAQSHFDINRLRLLIGKNTLLGAIIMGDQTLSRPLQNIVADQVDITSIREQLLAPDAPLSDLIASLWCQIVDRRN